MLMKGLLTPQASGAGPGPAAVIVSPADSAPKEPHMWIIAGILLGIVVLALEGHSSSVLWSIFTADLLVSAGIGTLAWKALSARRASPQPQIAPAHHGRALEGEEGVAVSALTPEGVVRVRGEQWTAVAANGSVPA